MNRETILTIGKSAIIIIILMAFVFALKAPAADLNMINDDMKGEYVDSSGLPYFSEMDSYYNLRLTQDYADHGYVGDKMVNGSEWDMHRYAPTGNQINYELGIVYVTTWLHDFVNNFFGHDYSIKEVAFWTGAIISTLAVIPVYIFSRRLSNDVGAIVATLIIVLAPNYFAHTFPGFFDTDMFYYIFSVFFIFFFVESIRTNNIGLKVLYAILSVISIGLFATQWTGYIFYVALMGLFVIVYLIACFIFKVGDDQSEYPNKLQWFIRQKDLLSVVILGVVAFVGLALFQGVDGVTGIFGRVFGLLSLQSASVVVGGFPNVLISVAEMQMPSLVGSGMNAAFLASTNGVVNGIGGITVLFAALATLFVFLSRTWQLRDIVNISSIKSDDKQKPGKDKRVSAAKKLDDERKFKVMATDLKFGSNYDIFGDKRLTILYATLFVVWVLVTALAVSRGSRFITTIVLPFGFLTGIFVTYVYEYLKERPISDKWLDVILVLTAFLTAVPLATINSMYGIAAFAAILIIGLISIYAIKPSATSKRVPLKKYIAIAAVVLALITPVACGAYSTSNSVFPGTSDPMWNSMQWINETQPEDTVITSWWDYGYLFEIAADRQVTFDGGSQSGDRAFWLGQAMTTDNLELSAGIFRMLDSSGELAVEKLVNVTGNTGKSTDILIDILPRTPSDAQNTLTSKYGLSAADAKEVVSYTHPDNPRPVIFVASSDMLQKAGWWSFFGAWDFDNQTSENYNYFVPTEQVKVNPGQTNKLVLMKEGMQQVNVVIERGTGNNTTQAQVETVNANTGEPIKINDTVQNPLKASNLIVIEDGYIMKNESIKNCSDGNYTLLLMGNDNQYTPILMHNKLNNSMFTQLYLLGGANQNIFEPVHSENGVLLFKVNFNNTRAGGGNSTGN